MASISAYAFSDPRISNQKMGMIQISFVRKNSSAKIDAEEYLLTIGSMVPGVTGYYGMKSFGHAPVPKVVNLPKKMTYALYRLAVLKGFAR